MSKDNWYLESKWSCRMLQRDLVYKEAREGNKVLDIGTGMGRTVRLLNESRKKVVGIDLDAELLRKARKINRNVNYVRGSALYLPFKPESFDGVILENVIEHILEHRTVLNEVRRILEEGGKLIISTPNKYLYRFFMYLRKIRDREFDKTWLNNPVPEHIAELTPPELRELLSNFKKLEIRGINPYLRSKNPWVGIDLLVVAVK